MRVDVNYLEPHPTTGVLRFRRVFPIELRPFISQNLTQLKRSIRAKKITEPGAMERYEAVAAEYELVVARARKHASGAYDQLTDPEIAYMAATFAKDQAEWVERRRLDEDAAEFAERALHGIWWMEDEYLQWRVDNDLDEMIEHWRRSAEGLLQERGITLAPDDRAGLGRLCRALNDVVISTRADQRARLKGEVVPLPPEPVLAVGKLNSSSAGVGNSFEDIATSILTSPRHGLSPSTRQAANTALRFFREANGPLRPAEITMQLVSGWLDVLAQRPTTPVASDRSLPLPALVAKYEGKSVARMSKKTQAVHLGHLAALWTRAQAEEGSIAADLPNPFKSRKSLTVRRREKKTEYSLDELHALFSLPVFVRGERPTGGKGDASYWMPLLLLFTGARPEEVAQLLVSDFFQAKEGRWFIRFTDEGDHPFKGKRRLKTSEHETGRRSLPVPEGLLRLNIVEYVEHLRAHGDLALFPLLRLKAGEDGRRELHAGFSMWWSRYVREHGVLPKGEGRRPLRELRDVWTTGARMSKIPKDAREYIQGRLPDDDSSDDVYGQHDVSGAWLHDWRYEGLELSAVKPWAPQTGL